MRVALVNTNRVRPPIAPIGLEYVAEALDAAGHTVEVLDLCWADDWLAAVASFFDDGCFGLVGVTLRNTDDCTFTTRHSFLPEFSDMVGAIRARTEAPIILGGVGFSVMPEGILSRCRADAGIWGEGEHALVELADRIHARREWLDVPNLVRREDGQWRRNPPDDSPLSALPTMTRRWVDNRRYFREGGQIGFESKRGCPGACVYCADPLAKGSKSRLRPPKAVADELENLLHQGVDHFHTCDGEFNLPPSHAVEVCEEVSRRGLGERMRWYAYCSPGLFSPDLARLMRRAGCVGINFGSDHGDRAMLERLGRDFTPEDILNAVSACREEGIAVMLDLLLGSPGETLESITRTVDLAKRAAPDCVGVAFGVRVYPGTELAKRIERGGMRSGLVGGGDPVEPVFFLEPGVADGITRWLDDLIGDDRRFLFSYPERPRTNYNYNANERLVSAIRKGFRGAYWDILRRCEG